MYFKFERRYNLLTVDDSFARLSSVAANGDMSFEFTYSVSQAEAVQRSALTVSVTVFSRNVRPPSLFGESALGSVDTEALISNILTQVVDAKSAAKQRESFVVARKNSDISAKINNEIVGQLRARAPASAIPQLTHSVLKLTPVADIKAANEAKPVLERVALSALADTFVSSSSDTNVRALMQDMVVRQGIDPSYIFSLADRSVSSVDSLGGTVQRPAAQESVTDPASQLLNFHVLNAESGPRGLTTDQLLDSTAIHVLSSETSLQLDVPVTVTVPATRVDGTSAVHYFVKFELVDGQSGIAVDTVVKPLDVSKHVQLYHTPKVPPVVRATSSEISSRINLEVKQADPSATAVQVFKKNVFRVVTDVDSYALVGTYDVKSNQQSLLVQVDKPIDSVIIYRVIPVGALGTVGTEYANVVTRGGRYRPIKSLSLTSVTVDTGVKVEARRIPQGVAAIEFLGRNMTTHDATYRNVGGDVLAIDASTRAADHVAVIDTLVNDGNVYEYVARLIYADGLVEYSGNETVEFIQPVPGQVDTKITDVTVDHGEVPNVTFTITTDIVDEDMDVVKELLQKQGLYDLFKDNVQNERDLLKSLIAHSVQRVDLTTGAREDFGVVNGSSFSDVDLGKNQAISALKLGHRYRYAVSALLRAPETMFETFQKVAVDRVTKKSYTFSPAKFLHPIALTRGVLVTSQGLKTNYTKKPMAHGEIGVVQTVEVSFDSDITAVINPIAAKFDARLNVVTWQVRGPIDQIDHFLVMKQANGVRTLVGKAHSEFPNSSCQYLHVLGSGDVGSFAYVIVPVFNDYKTGASSVTNAVVV